MKALFIAICLMFLFSCASPLQQTDSEAKTLLETLKFEPDEKGCVELRVSVDLNPAPFFTTMGSIIYKKEKNDGEPNAPRCG